MKKHTCLIIKDTKADQDIVQELLKQVPLLMQVDCCTTAADAFRLLTEHVYDLIFLDMQLPGQSGLDWLRASPHRPPVIITTAFPDFAVDCYDLNVADYLLKPFPLIRLQRALNRALTMQVSERSLTDRDSIYLYHDRRLQQFRFDDILYFEAYGAYTKIHSITDFVAVNESISAIEERLPGGQFMRIQKSFIVNIDKLTAVGHRQVWLNDVQIPIGTQYRESLRQLISRTTP